MFYCFFKKVFRIPLKKVPDILQKSGTEIFFPENNGHKKKAVPVICRKQPLDLAECLIRKRKLLSQLLSFPDFSC